MARLVIWGAIALIMVIVMLVKSLKLILTLRGKVTHICVNEPAHDLFK